MIDFTPDYDRLRRAYERDKPRWPIVVIEDYRRQLEDAGYTVIRTSDFIAFEGIISSGVAFVSALKPFMLASIRERKRREKLERDDSD